MDIKGLIKSKTKNAVLANDPLIRTMQGDIIALEGKNNVVSPPDKLPIIESVKKPETEAQKQIQEKIRRTQEIAAQKQAEEQKRIMERIEKQRIEAQKQAQERAKEEAEKRRKAEQEAKEQAEKDRKEREEAIEKAEKQKLKKLRAIKRKQEKFFPKLIAGLAVIFIIIGAGVFFYWWNYLRFVPPIAPITHYQCLDNQCVSIEGEGQDQCLINDDCFIQESISLIQTTETKIIELSGIEEENLLQKIKMVLVQEQEKNNLKRILVKISNSDYLELKEIIGRLGITMPIGILETAVETNNYTLFYYNQTEGGRLGLIIKMGKSDTLVGDLRSWEQTMQEDLGLIFLQDDVPDAFTQEFQDNLYNDVAIRYLNFPTSDLSIDYAIVDDKLIITTSKESMYAAISILLNIE